jgi:hypothetical protein
MSEMEKKANAMIQELIAQRNSAFDRCVLLSAELALLQEKLSVAEAAVQKEETETKE